MIKNIKCFCVSQQKKLLFFSQKEKEEIVFVSHCNAPLYVTFIMFGWNCDSSNPTFISNLGNKTQNKQHKRKNNLDEAKNIDKMVSKAFLIHWFFVSNCFCNE
jgi:hypothetical protein